MPNTLSFEDAAPASTLSFEDAAPKPEPLSFEDAAPPDDSEPRFQDANGFVYTGNKTDSQSTPALPTTQMGDARSESPDVAFASAVGEAVPKAAEFARKYANPVTFIPRLGHTVSQIVGTTPKDEPFFADSETPMLKVDVAPNATDMGKGMGDFIKGMVEGLSTPKATSEMAAAMAGAPVAKIVSADFLSQMAAQAPEQASAAYEAIKRGDTREAVKNVLNFSLSAGAPLLGIKAVEASKAKVEGGSQNLESETAPETAKVDIQEGKPTEPIKPKGEKPVVPETPPEEERGINVSEEIRQKGARTIADIQRLYPLSNLSREQARALRDQAWGKTEQPVPVADEQPAPTAATPPIEQPTINSTPVDSSLTVEPTTEVAPSSRKVNPAVKSVFDKLDNDENYTVRDAAEELAHADKLPREVRSALKQYQKNREADVKEFGQRSGLEEEGADALQAAIENHVGGEAEIPQAKSSESNIDVSPITNAKTSAEAVEATGRLMRAAKTDAELAKIQAAIKSYKEPISNAGDQATEVAEKPTAKQLPNPPAGISATPEQWADMATLNDAAQLEKYGTTRAKLFEESALKKAQPQPASAAMPQDWVKSGKSAQFTQEMIAKKNATKPLDTPATAVEKPEQQTFTGMGGATPSEFDPIGKSPTAMKYKLIDQERVERGLEPIAKPAKVSDPVAFTKAEAAFDNDPTVGATLVKNILDGKRKTIEDWENHVLLLQKIGLRDQYYKSAREATQAFEDGRTDDVAEANIRTAEWADKLNDVEQASRISGSARGRALRSLQVMANEDMTLASLEMQKRASKGGAPLTVDERAQLQKVADEYKAKLDAYEKYQAARETKIKEDALKEAFARVQQENRTPQYHPKVLERAEQLVAKLEVKASAALKDLLGATWSPGPEVLGKMALVGAAKLARGVLEVSKWTDAMVRDLGERFRPYAQQVYDLANKELEKQLGPSAKVVLEKGDLNQQRDALVERIAERVKDGKTDELSAYIQRLAKVFYKQGVVTREGMVDALHGFLEPITQMTRREVADAFSGYGEFKQLSKDQITVALRGMKGELQQLAKLEDMAAGKPPLKSGLERRAKTDAERQIEKLVNEAKYKFQIPITDPNTQLKSALDTFKTQMANRIKDYEQRLADKDFAPKPKRELVLDARATQLKADYERVKRDWDIAKRNDQLAQRKTWQKAADGFVRWERAFKLSSPAVFGKLAAAALTRFVTTAVEEGVGGVLSKLPGISRIADRAPREGGINTQAMAKAVTDAFTKGIQDAGQTAKKGASDLDVVYGGKLLDKDWANFFGQLHGMMKAPVKRAEFELSFQKRVAFAIKNGVDVTNPAVQMRLASEALQDGYHSIFMQKGFASDFVNTTISMAERSKKYPVAGEITARTMRFLMPVVRVPLNIVAETASGVYGAPVASARTMFHAIRGTLDTLDPQTADSIMRQFKKGSIGLGLMAIGYYNAQNIGGYYRPGVKQREGEPKFGGFKVGETDIPRWMTHAPWFELMQFGATMRRTLDNHVQKGKDDGVSEAAWAAGLGLVEETPFTKTMLDVSKLFGKPDERQRYTGELAKSTVVPQLVSKIADMTDDEGVKRDPKTVIEHIETGVPGLRQQVPVKVKKSR